MENGISGVLIKSLVKNGNKSLAQEELEKILNHDIHDKSLGCKISNTHVRIGKVHLDTFYEAQLLFGNAYWTDIFSYFLYDFIISKIKDIDNQKNKPIILFGYETYSTLTLNKTISLLQNDGYLAYLRIYEVRDNRIRYCDESLGNTYEPDMQLLNSDPIVFYFVGISSTLSTFKHMNDALLNINDKYSTVTKYCVSIIQVIGSSDDMSNKFIRVYNDEKFNYAICQNDENYLHFISEPRLQKVFYYVSVASKWYTPDTCKLCMPESDYLTEQPLIEVNESSVVPTQMIRLDVNKKSPKIDDPISRFSNKNSVKFINNLENKKYLYYDHIERNNNHYQYYFRLSRIYHDKKDEIEKWLSSIKNEYNFMKEKTINIIVSPQHYSNTGFINSVNNILFEGTAHIMEFDIHKEYRSNFMAKYNNYSEIEKIISKLKDYSVDFYYVNDQIVSGSAFYRTKSLINSLYTENSSKFNIFSGIILLFNRNSFETRKNYVNTLINKKSNREYKYLPFFSYLNIDIPSLRSHDDSCPLCFETNKSWEIINECALDKSALFWQEKIVFHRKKSISEVRNSLVNSQINENHFRKLQCENDLWIAIKEAYNKISTGIQTIDKKDKSTYKKDTIIDCFYICIQNRLSEIEEDSTKIEYLISYIKTMSRALLYYQEDVKKACLYILLKIFDYFLLSSKNHDKTGKLVFPDCFPIGNNSLSLNINADNLLSLRYDLFRITITRLCAIGSCVLLNKERLIKCRLIGNYLYNDLKNCSENFDIFLLNSLKKLLCYDKGIFKAELLDHILWDEANDTLFNDDKFYSRLFLENMRNPKLYKNEETVRQISDLRNDDVTEKYANLANILKNECKEINDTPVEIQFFTSTANDKSTFNVVNITDGTIAKPTEDVDYKHDKTLGVYYVRIGNNFDELKKIEFAKQNGFEGILENELKIIKNANIIIGIKTNNIKQVAQILKYRKEILEMVQTDFNNEALSKLIITHGEAIVLSEIKTVTHKDKPLQEFENIFKCLYDSNQPSLLQRKLLSLYMDTVISIAYREELRFNKFKFSSQEQEGSMFDVGYNVVGESFEYAENQIIEQYHNIKFNIGNIKNEHFEPYDKEEQKEIKTKLKDDYMIVRFRKSNEICEAYMLIKTFIDNANKHCVDPEIQIKLIENENGNFDLLVENNIHKRRSSPSDKGITLEALKYIFNKNSTQIDFQDIPKNNMLIISEPIDSQSNTFKITFKNFIKKII